MSDLPGSFDLQVNGYGGVDFNKDDLTADELHFACERMRADGVGGFLATIITEDVGRLFNHLSGMTQETQYKRLLVAPHGIRIGLIDRI